MKVCRTACALAVLALAAVSCGPNPNGGGETQTGTIVGTLIDSATNLAIPSATVVVGENVRNVVNSDGGKFLLKNVPIGNQTLVIRAIGYATETETILVTKDNTSKAGDDGVVRLTSILSTSRGTPTPAPH